MRTSVWCSQLGCVPGFCPLLLADAGITKRCSAEISPDVPRFRGGGALTEFTQEQPATMLMLPLAVLINITVSLLDQPYNCWDYLVCRSLRSAASLCRASPELRLFDVVEAAVQGLANR